MADAVEGARDCGRGADLGLDNDDVLCGNGAAAELGEQRVERVPRIGTGAAVRQDIAVPAERVACLLEAELPNVARDRRLRDGAAGALERLEQLLLRAEPHALDEARNEPLAVALRELTV